jgi:hypothetical protein
MVEKSKKYSGELNEKLEPIYSSILGSIGQNSPVYMPEDIQKRNTQIDTKMLSLFKHFGINDSNMTWKNLAYALAAAHVPGLQVSNPDVNVGVKKKWTDDRLAVLLVCMRMEMETEACATATHAAKNLAKKAPWNTLVNGKNAPEALRKQYETYKDNKNIKEYARWYRRDGGIFESNISVKAYEKKLAEIVERGELKGVWK